jgi:hypothetical protein
MKKQIKWLFLFSVLFAGCEKELEQYPMDTTSKHAVFSSETGLKLYTNSFYEILPSANNIHTADCMSDYGARRAVPRFLIPGAYDANTSDDGSASGRDVVALGADADWEWEELRNVNYYIANANDPAIPSETQRHYLGVAKFFRAFL